MIFKISKMVVAADDSPADAIAALRAQLEGANQTAEASTTGAEETLINPDGSIGGSSTENGEGFKPVGKAVVAADSSAADAIAALREQLAGGGETMVNQDGTVLNPADPMSASSLANGDGFKPVDKAVVAADVQWYQTNPMLQKAEIKAMADIHPDAKMGYLPNGRMYWTVRIHPVVCGKRKDWTLLAVYDPDHPQQRWGGSVKFYPVKPNYDEMMQLVNRSSVTPKSIPHLLRDEDDQIYMCTQDRNNISAGQHKGEKVTTAAACLRFAMRWITVFELGLIDQKTWTMFQHHGEI